MEEVRRGFVTAISNLWDLGLKVSDDKIRYELAQAVIHLMNAKRIASQEMEHPSWW
jgi:hypothetical protein